MKSLLLGVLLSATLVSNHMTVFNYAQLEQLWINANGPKAVAPIMAAIAMAESGGNSTSNNYTDNNGTQTSWGLWQISNGTHSWPGPADPSVPANNAAYAVAKYNADKARGNNGFQPWGTYTSGLYKQYLKGSVPPDSSVPGGPSGEHSGPGSPAGSPGGLTAIAQRSSGDAFSLILDKAKAGTLTYPDFLQWWNSKGAFEPATTNVKQVQQILSAVKTSQPNTSWVKDNLVSIRGNQVQVMLQTTPAYPGQSVVDYAAQHAATTGADLFALVSVFNDFFNYLKAIIGLIVNPSFWLRVGAGIGGFIVLIIGGYMIVSAN